MNRTYSGARSESLGWIALAVLIAMLSGATVVVAPVLLGLPVLALAVAGVLYVAIRASRTSMGVARESWPNHALTALWVIVISLPSVVAFDQTGFTKDQGLFNPQSLGRILIFFAVGIAALVFWARWGRSPLRNKGSGIPKGAKLVTMFYAWYVVNAPMVLGGTALALSLFRSFEWLLATWLLVLLFGVQNAQGKNAFADRMKLVVPMLFFLLLSNLIAFPVIPGMIYSVSAITGTGRFGGLFTHPNLLALVCVLLCAYGLAFMAGWRRNILLLVSIGVLVLTYSRGGFAAFAIMAGLAVWFLVRGVGTRLVLIGIGFVVAIVLLQFPQVEEKALGFLARGSKTQNLGSLSERTAVWEASKILIQRSPWLGSGFVAGPKLLADVMIENRLSTNFAAPHAHNEFLQAQISGGPIALVLSLLLQLRIALLLLRGEGLQANERFFGWSVLTGCLVWGFLQPSLSYFLYLPGVLLIWLLLTLEGLRKGRTPATATVILPRRGYK